MGNLATKHVDPAEATDNLVAAIRDEVPSARVTTESSGSPTQPSFRGAFGHELAGYFRSTEAIAFEVQADWTGPRPMRVQCRYVQVGRQAGPLSVLYLTRLRVVVPGTAVIRRKWARPLTRAVFDGDPTVKEPLAAAPGLGKGVARFLQPSLVIGNAVFKIEPFVEVDADDDGALFAAFTTPARGSHGFGGYHLDIRAFLEIADAVERTLTAAPGTRPVDHPNIPLPGAAA